MNKNEKVYLGDGVYAVVENTMIKLTTEYGDSKVTNTIYLEASVVDNFVAYLERLKNAL